MTCSGQKEDPLQVIVYFYSSIQFIHVDLALAYCTPSPSNFSAPHIATFDLLLFDVYNNNIYNYFDFFCFLFTLT